MLNNLSIEPGYAVSLGEVRGRAGWVGGCANKQISEVCFGFYRSQRRLCGEHMKNLSIGIPHTRRGTWMAYWNTDGRAKPTVKAAFTLGPK